MPFSLAILAEAEGVVDGTGLGRVGVVWAFGVEREVAPFDDAGVGAVSAWR